MKPPDTRGLFRCKPLTMMCTTLPACGLDSTLPTVNVAASSPGRALNLQVCPTRYLEIREQSADVA